MDVIKSISLCLILACLSIIGQAQSYAWGIKLGPSMGIQQWEGVSRSPLFKYHAVAFIESADGDERFSLYAQSGYHIRGSAVRNRRVFGFSGSVFDLPTQEYIFRNISLSLGAKSHQKSIGYNSSLFYAIAIRGEYTLSTNFDEFPAFEDANGRAIFSTFPVDEFVRKFNYGISVAGGLEWRFAETVGAVFELTVSPDFSKQYQQPPFQNVFNPFTGNTQDYRGQRVVNVSLELSVGLRFFREIIYID